MNIFTYIVIIARRYFKEDIKHSILKAMMEKSKQDRTLQREGTKKPLPFCGISTGEFGLAVSAFNGILAQVPSGAAF